MAPRIQFRLSDEEYSSLEETAKDRGFPDVGSFVRHFVLNRTAEHSTPAKSLRMAELYREAVSVINSYPAGKKFIVADLIPNPPALLGRYIFKAVEAGDISDVKHIGKREGRGNEYLKLGADVKQHTPD